MQENFIFFDTESNIEQVNKKTKNLTFKLGTSIIWNRIENKVKRFVFYDISKFWNEVDKGFDVNKKQYILFAHNVHFDMKMVDGFNQLSKRGWELINHYVRNRTYILLFKKNDYLLHIWDTSNYFIKGFSVADIGEVLGYPKLKVNFDKCSIKELEIYCMRDTEILYKFIEKMIDFLTINDLSRIKATASSLSFNAFRHKFYNPEKNRIWIHDFKRAILLERMSYRGGITDVFRLGKHKDITKLDINSHYPKPMKEMKLPTKLLFYSHESDKKLIGFNDDDDVSITDLTDKNYKNISKKLMRIYNLYKKDYGIITRATIFIPKKYAYLLYDFGLGKTSFAWGKFEIVLCSPELEFVERYGKIIKIHEINIYEVRNVFKEFVEFFYDLKEKYTREGNKIFANLAKLFLNGFYGKWGQKEYISERLDETHDYLIKNQDLILDIVEEKLDLINNSSLVYLGSINSKELYVIDRKLYLAYQTDNNSKDSFVAISSFITSKARMNLVDFILVAKRKNVCYVDTDSLFINKKGLKILQEGNYIDDYELGKLKIEGFGEAEFFNPKFYDFYDYDSKEYERKCKGIKKKNSKLIYEDKNIVKYEVEQWDKFKTDYKKGNFTNQLINIVPKVMSKKYDKGKILNDGFIEPFHISEIRKE
ncbi:MAG: DNA polymerase [Candidatus Hermodarchaeota archaeon]